MLIEIEIRTEPTDRERLEQLEMAYCDAAAVWTLWVEKLAAAIKEETGQ